MTTINIQQTAIAAFAAIILSSSFVAAAIGPASAVERAPISSAHVQQTGQAIA